MTYLIAAIVIPCVIALAIVLTAVVLIINLTPDADSRWG